MNIMTERRAHLMTALENNLQKNIALFKTFSAADLGLCVYQDGAKWTVKQLLAHFITIERSMHWLFKNILSGGPGSPEDFDVDRYNETQPKKLDGLSIDELVTQFRAVRDTTITIVKEMSEEDLDREGRHAFHGHGKLERFIHWAYEHVEIHLNDIRSIVNTAKTT